MGKSRLRDKAEHPAKPEGFYHWYDDPLNCCQEMDGELLRELIHPYVSKNPLRPIDEKKRQKFLQIMKRNTAVVRLTVATLLEMCKLFGIAPYAFERMKLFKRDYPISLGQPSIYKLMTHLINEANVVYRGRRYSTTRGHYYNLDMSLHDRVAALVTSLGGKWSRGLDSDNIPYTYVDAAVTRLLVKAGMVPWKKTQGQYLHHLPKRILDDPELTRYHISTTMTEEGWPSLGLKIGSKPRIMIGYSRSIDVTDILPKEYLHSVEIGKKYSLGQIPSGIRYMIREQPFPLLRDEINIIEKSGIETSIYLTGLYKSKKERVTVEWRVTLEGPEFVKRYTDSFGFLAGSKIEKRFKLIYRLYEEYKDRYLSQYDLDYINGQLA